MGFLYNTLLVTPIINVLVALYQLLFAVGVPYALGFAIILLTIVIRLLLYPLIASQLRASKKMQDVAPHINRLREKHKSDPQKLQQETLALYREHGVNPAAGCLPVLVQLPIIFALYGVLQKVVTLTPEETVKAINDLVYFDFLKLTEVWDTTFFGIPLGQKPSELLSVVGPVILLVPLITGFLQFLQSKMMVKPVAEQPKKKDTTEPDFASAFQTQSLYVFPLLIAFSSYSFPFGLSLYWNTFTIFGIIQQYKMQGLGSLENLFNKPTHASSAKVIQKQAIAEPDKKKKKQNKGRANKRK